MSNRQRNTRALRALAGLILVAACALIFFAGRVEARLADAFADRMIERAELVQA